MEFPHRVMIWHHLLEASNGCGEIMLYNAIYTDQIISTSHDLTPKGSILEGKSYYFSEI